jgi:DNA-directed RNA polymerase specialized sigma24 family protein
MTKTTRATLRALLETSYAAFRDRLKKPLGSEDLADEVLQDTWLRLASGGDVGVVQSPDNYVPHCS